jgi:hypothetical protein
MPTSVILSKQSFAVMLVSLDRLTLVTSHTSLLVTASDKRPALSATDGQCTTKQLIYFTRRCSIRRDFYGWRFSEGSLKSCRRRPVFSFRFADRHLLYGCVQPGRYAVAQLELLYNVRQFVPLIFHTHTTVVPCVICTRRKPILSEFVGKATWIQQSAILPWCSSVDPPLQGRRERCAALPL